MLLLLLLLLLAQIITSTLSKYFVICTSDSAPGTAMRQATQSGCIFGASFGGTVQGATMTDLDQILTLPLLGSSALPYVRQTRMFSDWLA